MKMKKCPSHFESRKISFLEFKRLWVSQFIHNFLSYVTKMSNFFLCQSFLFLEAMTFFILLSLSPSPLYFLSPSSYFPQLFETSLKYSISIISEMKKSWLTILLLCSAGNCIGNLPTLSLDDKCQTEFHWNRKQNFNAGQKWIFPFFRIQNNCFIYFQIFFFCFIAWMIITEKGFGFKGCFHLQMIIFIYSFHTNLRLTKHIFNYLCLKYCLRVRYWTICDWFEEKLKPVVGKFPSAIGNLFTFD